jgi:hypothetical protein
MVVTSQLRIYTINRGQMDAFVKVWQESVLPLRRKLGFTIDGAWVMEEENKFVWVLTYDGPDSWEERNAAYFSSPERKAMQPDPADWVAHIDVRFITPVPMA